MSLAGLDRAPIRSLLQRKRADREAGSLSCQLPGCNVADPEALWVCLSSDVVLCGPGSANHVQALEDSEPEGAWRIHAASGAVHCCHTGRELVTADEMDVLSKDERAGSVLVRKDEIDWLRELRSQLAPGAGSHSVGSRGSSAAAEAVVVGGGSPPGRGSGAPSAAAAAAEAGAAPADPRRAGDAAPGAASGSPRGLAVGDAAPESMLAFHEHPDPSGGVTGLHNLGNTCFLNGALQALMCVPHFAQSFRALGPTAHRTTSARRTAIVHAVTRLVRAVWGGDDGGAVAPDLVLDTLRRVNRMFAGFQQHDAHEAMRFVLNDVHEFTGHPEENWVGGPPSAAGAGGGDGAAEGAPPSPGRSTASPLLAAAAATAAAAGTGPASPSAAALGGDAAALTDPDAEFHWANRCEDDEAAMAAHGPPAWCSGGPYVPPPSAARSPVSEAFEGVMCSRVRCRHCHEESVTFDTFTDMSLQIPEAPHPAVDAGLPSPGTASTDRVRRSGFQAPSFRRGGWCSFGWGRPLRVEDCLHAYCSPDALTGDEKYRCERCGELRDADKAFAVARLPEVLCLHLKRFSHTSMWGKLGTRVDFPVEGLDMEPFVWADSVAAARATVAEREARERRAAAAAAREWSRGRSAGEAVGAAPPAAPPVLTDTPFSDALARRVVAEHDRAEALRRAGVAGRELAWGGGPAGGPFQYDLVSVVEHMGGMGGGHYIAHGRRAPGRQWYVFDDSRVSASSAEAVAGREGYILFFERRRVAPARLPMAMPPPAGSTLDTGGPHCWVSARWWLRRAVFSCPGPVTSFDVCCPHGRIRNAVFDQIHDPKRRAIDPSGYLVPVTEAQWHALVATYGRQGPVVYRFDRCPACAVEARALAVRRAAETAGIAAVDSTTLPAPRGKGRKQAEAAAEAAFWHLIGTRWVNQWHAFKDNAPGGDDGTGRGSLPPGPVDNSSLLRADGTPKGNLRAVTHYRGVNAKVWRFFHDLYGGGPLMRRRDRIQIEDPPVDAIPPDLLGTASGGGSGVHATAAAAGRPRPGRGSAAAASSGGRPSAVAPVQDDDPGSSGGGSMA